VLAIGGQQVADFQEEVRIFTGALVQQRAQLHGSCRHVAQVRRAHACLHLQGMRRRGIPDT
jgi:hypothetical protein